MNSEKAKIRASFLKKRLSLARQTVLEKSNKISEKFQKIPQVQKAKKIQNYLPIKNEVETKQIIDGLVKRGKIIYLPFYRDGDYYLSRFEDWDKLEKGPFGILQPIRMMTINPREIDIAVLPGLAFSRTGLRLGYGKGVFDRLFGKSKALRIGLAYEFQIVNELPKEKHDLVMDIVVSEKEVYRI